MVGGTKWGHCDRGIGKVRADEAPDIELPPLSVGPGAILTYLVLIRLGFWQAVQK
jgi:hypothetical protein